MALGGRGSERVRLSGRWRPDPESRSVVSKGWAKWKGKGPSPGTGKNKMDVRKEPWEPRKETGTSSGGKAWQEGIDNEGLESGVFPELALVRVHKSCPFWEKQRDSPVHSGA